MRKLRPDSNQSHLSPEDAERLMEACRTMSYGKAAEWARKNLNFETTTASLCRWYGKQRLELTSGDLRKTLAASEEFNSAVDSAALDSAMANALRTKFWTAIQTQSGEGNIEHVAQLGKLTLDVIKSTQNDKKITLLEKRVAMQEDQLRVAGENYAALQARCKELEERLAEATKPDVDPAAVAAALDRKLGRKGQP